MTIRKTKGGPSEFDVSIGQRVRMQRSLLGWSQEKLADALGITFQQVQKYENGVNRISAGRIYELSVIMGVPVAAFSAPGPIDIIPGSNAGVLAPGQTDGLKEACLACLDLDRTVVRKFAEKFSWRSCAEEFFRNLQPYPEPEKTRFWRRLRRLARLRKKTAA